MQYNGSLTSALSLVLTLIARRVKGKRLGLPVYCQALGDKLTSALPFLEISCTPYVNSRESRQHHVLFYTNKEEMAVAFRVLLGDLRDQALCLCETTLKLTFNLQ